VAISIEENPRVQHVPKGIRATLEAKQAALLALNGRLELLALEVPRRLSRRMAPRYQSKTHGRNRATGAPLA
jgi:hypothetical protein